MTTRADFCTALAAVERVLVENAPIHGDRWRQETPYAHVAHAVAHLQVWMAERRLEDLAHAATRALMALELALRPPAEARNGDAA